MEAENVAPGHVYYLGIQYIFTVRPHSQLRRNLLESDWSGASRNTTTSTTYPNSTSDLIFLFNHEGQKCILYYLYYISALPQKTPQSSTVYKIFSDGRQRNWRDKKLDCYMLDQRLAGNFRIIFNYVLSSSLPLDSNIWEQRRILHFFLNQMMKTLLDG